VLLGLLSAGDCTAPELAARWPARSIEGIGRTAASLVALGLISGHAGGWALNPHSRDNRDQTRTS
jgi:hypothetical protein